MVYSVSRTKPGARTSEIVVKTASRSKAYRYRAQLQKHDPECEYGIGMVVGADAGAEDEGAGEGFTEYISKTAVEILGS